MDVAVVGAGLAGLAAAVELVADGHSVQVFEADDRAGGRVRTDEVDGHLLDRGFQVLLDAYPEVWNTLDLTTLDMKYFHPGALTRYEGAFHRVSDPFQDPSELLRTMRAPIGSFADKVKILALRRAVRRGSLDDLWQRPETTALERLQTAGFSDAMIDRFLRPLFAGITLDADLGGSSRMLEFVFRMLSAGQTGVPSAGMAAIPAQLVSRLPEGTIRLNTPVVAVNGTDLTLGDGEGNGAGNDGEVVSAEAIVIATDQGAAAELCQSEDTGWLATTTLWLKADRPPEDRPILMLNGEGRGPINSVAVMSQVSPDYAPSGSSTIAVSAPTVDAELVEGMRSQLVEWFGSEAATWETLRVDEIRHAHPIHPLGRPRPAAVALDGDGGGDEGRIVVCGDHLSDPSINGAIYSGRAGASIVAGWAND